MPVRRSARLAAKSKAKVNADESIATEGQTSKGTAKPKTKPSRRVSRSRGQSSCSLQSLAQPTRQSQQINARKTTETQKIRKDPEKPHSQNQKISFATSNETTRTMRRFTSTPVAKSKRIPSVTPTDDMSRGVRFNLGRNSWAQYRKDNPPNIVEHLTHEVEDELLPSKDNTANIGDEETRRNEEILAEWDVLFEDDETEVGAPRRRRSRGARRMSMFL